MRLYLRKYWIDDHGAVTIDWVVITGFVVGLALSVAAALSPSLETRGTELITPVTISSSF